MKHSNQTHTVMDKKKISHRYKRPVEVSPLEITSLEEVNIDGEGLDLMDPNYQSELDYDGYESIEAYDNHAYRFNVEGKDNPEKELNFEGAKVKTDMGEEDFVDPQGNHE